MRLIHLEVHNWRLHRRVDLAFHEQGTLIHGPNEAGKSTLFEVIRRLLFDRAQTESRWVRRLSPYATSGVLPRGSLTFLHRGRYLQVTKEFGGKGSTTLEEKIGEKFKLIAQQQEAEEQLREILQASDRSTQSDGAAPEHWGPFHWLFVPQSARGLPEPGSQATRYLGLEQSGITDAYQRVLEAVQKKFLEFFTQTTGRPAAHSPLKQAIEEVTLWETRAAQYQKEVADLEVLQQQYASLIDELPELERQRDRAKRAFEQAKEEESGMAEAEEALKAVQAEVTRDKKAHDAAVEQVEDHRKLVEKLKKTRESRQELERQYAAEEARFKVLEQQWKKTREEARKGGDIKADLQARLKDADQVAQGRSLARQIEELSQRLSDARDLDTRWIDQKARLLPDPPTQETVQKITVLQVQWQEKEKARVAAGMRVSRSPEVTVAIEIDGEAMPDSQGVAYQEIHVLFPEGGEITVEADLVQAQALQEEARRFKGELDEILGRYSARSVADLAALAREQQETKAEVNSLEKQRKALDPRKTSDIETALVKFKSEAVRLQNRPRHPGCAKEHDSLDDPSLNQRILDLQEKAQEAESVFEETRERRAKLDEEYEENKEKIGKLAQKLALAQQDVENAQEALDQHRDRHGSEEPCKLREEESARTLKEAEKKEQAARQRLEQLRKGQGMKVKTAKQKYESLDAIVRNKQQRVLLIEEQLNRDALKGSYSRMAEAEQVAESAKQRRDCLQIRAEAIRRLRDLLEEEKQRAVTKLVTPIKVLLDEALNYATQGDYTISDLDLHLQPQKLTSDMRQVEFEDSSDGLRELVAVLIRLSVAIHLSKEDSQTLLLDDPFIHVHHRRAVRVVELLNQAMEESGLQVVILTHRPPEFAGLFGKVIEISDLVQG